jgi:hypothetical protein
MRHFVDDDPGYLGWLGGHPGEFVLSTTRTPSPAYLLLHRATCASISQLQARAASFTGEYSQLCGGRSELTAAARRLGGHAQVCGLCL